MSPWIFKVAWCVLLLALALVCQQSPSVWARRLGNWLMLATWAAAAWFASGGMWLVTGGVVACCFLVPLAHAVYMSRTMRFTGRPALSPGSFTEDDLAELQPLTVELQELDFVLDRDYWLSPSPVPHGFRLFRHRDKPVCAAVGMLERGGITWFYSQFTTRAADGDIWLTWDFPLPGGMKTPPQLKIYRCLEAETTAELFAQHEAYLQINEVPLTVSEPPPDALALFSRLNELMINYNLTAGVLRSNPRAGGEIGYSWRGTWYVSRKVLWELVAG